MEKGKESLSKWVDKVFKEEIGEDYIWKGIVGESAKATELRMEDVKKAMRPIIDEYEQKVRGYHLKAIFQEQIKGLRRSRKKRK